MRNQILKKFKYGKLKNQNEIFLFKILSNENYLRKTKCNPSKSDYIYSFKSTKKKHEGVKVNDF